MSRADVGSVNHTPVSLIVRDDAGRHLFASIVIRAMAGGDPIGRTDPDRPGLPTPTLFGRTTDGVLETGGPCIAHGRGRRSDRDTSC